ncbi:hypothetical protein GCM10009527_049670 [Actinomadura nitritigenes]|uniref:PH domain-containing protein n=1 Tax=Actinomadura nitritigenes TaxID=134602 RepID=A0ABS3R9P6_9ACTN|nr:hypothetical protein [Actinomadura nitritigenes]MBO2442953.1 hypothetical protein [Actinomadura nitritigenes]
MEPGIVVVLNGLAGARKAGAVAGMAVGALMAAALGAAIAVGATRGSCSAAGVAAWAGGVAVLVATAVVWTALPRLRRRFAHPRVWLDGTVLHARLRDGLRSCDLATARDVSVEDVPPRHVRQWNPAFQRAEIVTVPGIARFRVGTGTGAIDFALYDTQRRAEVPRETLKALADAILAGPDREGRAGEGADDAVRKLREMAVAAVRLRGVPRRLP